MSKKTKKPANVNQLTQTHAKVQTSQLTSLDQIWGYNESALYGTINEEEYIAKINAMTNTDLETHAKAHGCWSVGHLIQFDPRKLKETLINKFRAYVVSLRKPSPIANVPKQKLSPEVQKILNEGR